MNKQRKEYQALEQWSEKTIRDKKVRIAELRQEIVGSGKNNNNVVKSNKNPVGRVNMAGKTHPISGVKYDADGFPLFKSYSDINLDIKDYLKSRSTHFNRASKALFEKIQNNPQLATKFTEIEIQIFMGGGVPKRFTWHHHQENGRMQLVDRKLHRQTGHDGGYSIWGQGSK